MSTILNANFFKIFFKMNNVDASLSVSGICYTLERAVLSAGRTALTNGYMPPALPRNTHTQLRHSRIQHLLVYKYTLLRTLMVRDTSVLTQEGVLRQRISTLPWQIFPIPAETDLHSQDQNEIPLWRKYDSSWEHLQIKILHLQFQKNDSSELLDEYFGLV